MRTLTTLCCGLALAAGSAVAAEAGQPAARIPARVDFSTCTKPVWPRESLQKEETGMLTLSFLISVEGKVKEAKVLQSSGYPLLDQAALDGLKQCRFSPVVLAGAAVEDWQKMQYVWTLEDPSREEVAAHELLRNKDYPGAARMMRAAAEKGRAQAQFKLAGMLYHGDGGAADPVEALQWLKKSASQYYVPAMGAYGAALLQQGGSDAEALNWLRDAAAKEDVNAMYLLAACHEEGRGTAVDLAQARYWFARAADKGHAEASKALKEL